MGIDLLDLTFRIEREFEIKLERNDVMELLHTGNTSNPPPGAWTDIQVSDFVKLVEHNIAQQKTEAVNEVYDRVCRQIVDTLGIDDSEIKPDAWMVRDLGME